MERLVGDAKIVKGDWERRGTYRTLTEILGCLWAMKNGGSRREGEGNREVGRGWAPAVRETFWRKAWKNDR